MLTMETARLVLRNFAASDWQPLRAMILQYETSEYAVYDHVWPTSAEEIKGIAESFARGDSYLAVCRKDTGQFIGFVALSGPAGGGASQDGPTFDLGYIFNSDHHGQGYATEACRALLAHAFDALRAKRVATGTAAANRPSCRLLERLGFGKTGEGTASFRNAPDGKPLEFVGCTFAITHEEWYAARRDG